MAWKQIVTELLWFLRGDTNIKFLHDNNCHIWDGDYEKSGRTDGELGPIYPKQWRSWGYDSDKWREDYSKLQYGSKEEIEHLGKKGIDQIANLINDLKTNPDSRRLMISAWNVGELDQMILPPCHYGFQVYTRELSHDERFEIYKNSNIGGRVLQNHITAINFKQFHFDEANIPTRAISLMWNQRSVDTPLGLPFNIASYGLLLHIIARAVNMVPDQLVGNLGDVHIYKNQQEGVKEQISRLHLAHPLPGLSINTEFWPTEGGECGVGPLTSNVDSLINNMQIDDFTLIDYVSEPAIKMPLSN